VQQSGSFRRVDDFTYFGLSGGCCHAE
jgi:hypothetical protein